MVRVVKKLGLLWVVCAVVAPLAAARGSRADSPRCDFKVTGPFQTDRPYQRSTATVVSKGSFRCVAAYPGTQVRVALQQRVNGHWTTLGQTRTTIDVASGRRYTVRTKVGCRASSTFTGAKIRTFFTVKTHSGRVVLPSAPERSLCRFHSTT